MVVRSAVERGTLAVAILEVANCSIYCGFCEKCLKAGMDWLLVALLVPIEDEACSRVKKPTLNELRNVEVKRLVAEIRDHCGRGACPSFYLEEIQGDDSLMRGTLSNAVK